MHHRSLRFILLTAFAIAVGTAHADGLSDLKTALQTLAGQQAIKGTVTAKTQHRQGEGQEATTDVGAATLAVEDSAQGLQLQFAPDMLARLQAEKQARENDALAKTPTQQGLGALGYAEIRAMTAAADSLKNELARATFKSEVADNWNGHPARLLNFDLGPGKLRAQDQKYIKKVEGSLQIWIAADGTPLESRSQMKLSGRAMVVISFETVMNAKVLYQRQGDRLIATRRESQNSASGAGEKGEDRNELSLVLR
ncbi:MAG TPA: hypothetical protein VGM81_04470 [Burkholderiaceae bacterium]